METFAACILEHVAQWLSLLEFIAFCRVAQISLEVAGMQCIDRHVQLHFRVARVAPVPLTYPVLHSLTCVFPVGMRGASLQVHLSDALRYLGDSNCGPITFKFEGEQS